MKGSRIKSKSIETVDIQILGVHAFYTESGDIRHFVERVHLNEGLNERQAKTKLPLQRGITKLHPNNRESSILKLCEAGSSIGRHVMNV